MAENYISLFDYAILLVYLFIIYFIAFTIKSRYEKKNPIVYKYFFLGLHAKILGAIGVCMIYIYYYEWGDTLVYHNSSSVLINLMYKDFDAFLDIMGGNLAPENYANYFDHETGYPAYYMYKDPQTFSVARYIAPFEFLGVQSYLVTSVLLSVASYTGIWKLYMMLNREYPGIEKRLAIAILFVPSVVFWGSGLLKDTITFAAACWYTYAFYKVFIIKEQRVINAIFVLISVFFILTIKPYIFVALFPGSLLWLLLDRLKRIKSTWFRLTIAPAFIIGGMGLGLGVLTQMGDQLGEYKLDSVVEKAQVTQDDLKREVYGDNSFDVGAIDGSVGGFVSKAPLAISTALFRPFLWEADNPVMLVSAVENLIILSLFISLFVKIKLRLIIKVITSQPIIMFCLMFSFMFAFSVGITTANFGALVRYKIPLMPYFLGALVIMQNYGIVLMTTERSARSRLKKLKGSTI
jgi:hypothetical protein